MPMCGCFALYGSAARLKEYFGTTNGPGLASRLNIAPSQTVPVVRVDETGSWVFALAHRSLIPFWAKNSTELQKPI